jgi:signal transduction histidine kinase
MTELVAGFRPGAECSRASAEDLRVRGLLHDLGHQLMTLSLLTDLAHQETAMSAESRQRMNLVLHEMFRAMVLITDVAPGAAGGRTDRESRTVDVRELAREVSQVATLAHETKVRVLPGRPVHLRLRPCQLWRVLTNLVDNAVRAAGPAGTVEICVAQEAGTVIEIADDGPGFGHGRPGAAGLGMSVVRQLLSPAGGRLEIAARAGGGTRARVIFEP